MAFSLTQLVKIEHCGIHQQCLSLDVLESGFSKQTDILHMCLSVRLIGAVETDSFISHLMFCYVLVKIKQIVMWRE